jgi:triosephosphate isomerase
MDSLAGNWKMYKTTAEAKTAIEGLKAAISASPKGEAVICPPFTAIATVAEAAKGSAIAIGAQNFNPNKEGAFTGEISAGMLKELGVKYVILGHSERRQMFGDTDEVVHKKVEAAIANKLIPIICVGESQQERDSGTTDKIVVAQTQKSIAGIPKGDVAGTVFAYEPIWAIGTGKTCTADEASRVCGVIRKCIAEVTDQATADQVRILYGGSVKPDTIKDQMSKPDIDGALVGGASLDPASFSKIVEFDK